MSKERARARERAYLLSVMDRISAKVERQMAREIKRTMLKAAALARQSMPTDDATMGHKKRVEEILYPAFRALAVLFTENIQRKLKSARGPESLKGRSTDGLITDFLYNWVAQYGAEDVTNIAETTTRQIKSITIEGLAEGLSEINLAKRLREGAQQFSVTRSRTIARTESHRAAMAAASNAAADLPSEFVQVWSSAGSDVRADHRDANNQARAIGESFTVGGEQLRYPGDPRGSAGNVINCRCVAIHELRE